MNEPVSSTSIVVAVDASPHADRAVRWAAEQARLEHRPLVVASAVALGGLDGADWPDALAGSPAHTTRALLERARRTAATATHLVRQEHPTLEVHPLALPGDPRAVLVELSHRVHLIVLGSRGRGSVRSMLLGSVSSAVATHAACPVVVCRPGGAGTQGVVVGADGTPESRPVLEFAFHQASLRGRPLVVVHSFWDAVVAVQGMSDSDAVAARLEDLHVALGVSVAGLAEKYPDVRVTRRLAHGLVDQVILGEDVAWDLVVVGRHPWRTLTHCLTGSVATAIIEHANTTVAVVPEDPGPAG